MRLRLLNFTLELPPGWSEITADLPGDAAPTIARDHGVGAVQFSQVEFEGGPPERLSAGDLLDMVKGIAEGDTGGTFDELTHTDAFRRVGAASLSMDGNFVRMWGVSDGNGVVVATYVCAWRRRRPTELDECARLIDTIRIVAPLVVGIA